MGRVARSAPVRHVRMPVEARRAQLLAVASRHFATRPYPEVHVQAIADDAGVSLSLIYHYFRDKQELFAAVVDVAIEDLGRATAPHAELRPLDRLRTSIDGYLDYVDANEHAYRTMHRGAQSGDKRVRQALEQNTLRQIDRLSEGLLGTTDAPVKVRLAFRGWLALVIASCLEWLDSRRIERAELRTLLLHALQGAVTGAFADTDPDVDAVLGLAAGLDEAA